MNKELRMIQKQAVKEWAKDYRRFEAKILSLQWLDEQGFEPPKDFAVHVSSNSWEENKWNICISFVTGNKTSVYAMNEEIQKKLRIVPRYNLNSPLWFNCPTKRLEEDYKIDLEITFGFEEALLEGFVGEFCVIKNVKKDQHYSIDNLEVTCFDV